MLPAGGCTGGAGATPPYSPARTRADGYPSAANRAFTILVETDDSKKPPEYTLRERGGHVARNVRVALAVADLAEPYVAWASRLQPAMGGSAGAGASSAGAGDEASVAQRGGGAQVRLRWFPANTTLGTGGGGV